MELISKMLVPDHDGLLKPKAMSKEGETFESHSNRSVTFYNCGFGDSFLIEDGHDGLVVDCGMRPSTLRGKPNFPAFSCLGSDISNLKQLSLLITHFHQDHIRRIADFKTLKPAVSTLYFRNLTRKQLSYSVGASLINLLAYGKSTRDFVSALTQLFWFNIKQSYFSPGTTVRCIKKGDRFLVGNTTFFVLWPDPGFLSSSNEFSPIEDCFESPQAIASSLHLNDEQSISLYSAYSSLSQESLSNEGDPKGFDKTSSSDGKSFPSKKDLVRLVDSIKSSLSDDGRDAIANFLPSTRKLENALSIVFEDIDHRLLMTGDITQENLDVIFPQSIVLPFSKETIIKAPHHGTARYSLDNRFFNKGFHFLVPNSKKVRKPGYGIFPPYSANKQCDCLNCGLKSSCTNPCSKYNGFVVNKKTFLF